MDLRKCRCLTMTLITVSTLLTNNIECASERYRDDKTRFNNVAESINYMHKYLHGDMPMEEKCKRYAVLSSRALREKLPYERTAIKVGLMDQQELDKLYHDMGVVNICVSLMSAIDRYRITKLAPPFIELIECLGRINSTVVKRYLSNDELLILLDLYKQVLGLPNTMIDIQSLNLSQFHPAFATTLKNLFGEYFDIDGIFGHIPLDPFGPRFDTEWPWDLNTAGPSFVDQRRAELRLCDREKQKSRDLYLYQRRERSRLTQQRLRMMDPEAITARNRRYQEIRRRARQEEQALIVGQAETPEELEVKERALLKREHQNKLRRQRRLELKAERRREPFLPELRESHLKYKRAISGRPPSERQQRLAYYRLTKKPTQMRLDQTQQQQDLSSLLEMSRLESASYVQPEQSQPQQMNQIDTYYSEPIDPQGTPSLRDPHSAYASREMTFSPQDDMIGQYDLMIRTPAYSPESMIEGTLHADFEPENQPFKGQTNQPEISSPPTTEVMQYLLDEPPDSEQVTVDQGGLNSSSEPETDLRKRSTGPHDDTQSRYEHK